jgi:PTH1 family peptidyl-tRNA hydrolase
MTGQRWLIAGLGNPGADYAGNRHNAGFLVADVLAARSGARFRTGKFRAMAADGRVSGLPAVIVKPLTYMNNSGSAVAGLSRYYRVPPEFIVVVHDELDLPFGTVRLKRGGGDNGHNGLRSVTASLGTRDYYRVRLGIGRPPGRMDPAAYVLRDFAAAERKDLPYLVDRAADAVEVLLTSGLGAAQNAIHGSSAPGNPSPPGAPALPEGPPQPEGPALPEGPPQPEGPALPGGPLSHN